MTRKGVFEMIRTQPERQTGNLGLALQTAMLKANGGNALAHLVKER